MKSNIDCNISIEIDYDKEDTGIVRFRFWRAKSIIKEGLPYIEMVINYEYAFSFEEIEGIIDKGILIIKLKTGIREAIKKVNAKNKDA